MSQMQQIKDRCVGIYATALTLYGLDLTNVRISFDLRGRSAGKAGGRGYRMPASSYYMKFNRDMLSREAFDHVLNDTVPHEIAHIVCFMKPELGKNHDGGWARVCRALGGTGDRTHKEEVVYGNGLTYEYTTTNGNKVRLSERKHRSVQMGCTLRYRRGLGTVNKDCAHAVVGHQGRTLAEPVRKVEAKPTAAVPANSPQVMEPWTRERIEAFKRAAATDPTIGRVLGAFTLRTPAPATPAPAPVLRVNNGESKAAVSRRLMLSGYQGGQTYDAIINAMIAANGYDRQLARATFKANAAKVGIPSTWGN
jgi:predicted SprT family Zn-dependent metalloprotease